MYKQSWVLIPEPWTIERHLGNNLTEISEKYFHGNICEQVVLHGRHALVDECGRLVAEQYHYRPTSWGNDGVIVVGPVVFPAHPKESREQFEKWLDDALKPMYCKLPNGGTWVVW